MPMRRLVILVPSLIVLGVTLIAALPWGIPAPSRFVLALLPVVAITHFTLIRAGLVPTPIAFAAGLMLDVLTYGPLGYWAAINVAAQMLAALAAPGAMASQIARSALVGSLVAVMTVIGWAIASLAFNEVVAWRPLAVGAVLAILAHPVLAALARPFERELVRRVPLQLDRGG
jgi:rod shape-determining protein MreD